MLIAFQLVKNQTPCCMDIDIFLADKEGILVASTVSICLGKAVVHLGSRTCNRKAGKAVEADKECWEFRADTCTACRKPVCL